MAAAMPVATRSSNRKASPVVAPSQWCAQMKRPLSANAEPLDPLGSYIYQPSVRALAGGGYPGVSLQAEVPRREPAGRECQPRLGGAAAGRSHTPCAVAHGVCGHRRRAAGRAGRTRPRAQFLSRRESRRRSHRPSSPIPSCAGRYFGSNGCARGFGIWARASTPSVPWWRTSANGPPKLLLRGRTRSWLAVRVFWTVTDPPRGIVDFPAVADDLRAGDCLATSQRARPHIFFPQTV